MITLGPGQSYDSVPCNGQYGDPPGASSGALSGNTALDALDEASKIGGFTYDGYYAEVWNEFFINSTTYCGIGELGRRKSHRF